MSKFVAITAFSGQSPPWSLTALDANDSGLSAAAASANADATYAVDTGAANAYVLALPAGVTATLTAPLLLWWKSSATNTGASTLAVGALAAQPIINPGGSALSAGQIPTGGVVGTIYDGTNYYLVGGGVPQAGFSAAPITNSLSGDVVLNNSSNYFDGPTIAQGSVGTWWVSGTVTMGGEAGGIYDVKLWDGTTVIASTQVWVGTATGDPVSASLHGFLASPAGNLKFSVKDTNGTSGSIKFNISGNSKDSTISAFRIV